MQRQYTSEEHQFILNISQTIVAHAAFVELSLFRELAEEFFDNPVPLTLNHLPDDDPLAAGLTEPIVPVTYAAIAITMAAFDYVHNSAPSEAGSTVRLIDGLQSILRNQRQREELQQLIYQQAITFLMPTTVAQTMAGVLLDTLGELASDTQEQKRMINAWLEGHTPAMPLLLGQRYQLNFNIASPRPDALASEELALTLPPEQDQVEIMVFIDTDAFTIHGADSQILTLPRTGSSNTVQFSITPERLGVGIISAFFILNNQTFQKLQITLQISDPAAAPKPGSFDIRAHGLTLESALRLPPARQCVNLIIVQRVDGYRLLVQSDSAVWRAFININEAQLTELVADAHNTLQTILKIRVDKLLVYRQMDSTIPQEVYEESLRMLAELGAYLYDKLFYSGRSKDARDIGDLLRDLMRTSQFNIKVIAERFVFPWALLYSSEKLDTIDTEAFWGFKHLIACMPEFSQPVPIQFTPRISAGPKLHLGFVYGFRPDRREDKQEIERQQLIERQRHFFRELPGLVMSEYPNRQSLFALLNDPIASPHIIYFYCHAVSHGLGEFSFPGEATGVAQSRLILSDGDVTLFDLQRRAPDRLPPLKQAPLIFLNACESAKLGPYLYDGLVPYMLSRGARGVLGTESEIPISFAAEFGEELISRLVAGEATLGEIVLQLRQEYVSKKRNLLGLVYTLYGSTDIIVDRGVG
jgi:hypothetical protein